MSQESPKVQISPNLTENPQMLLMKCLGLTFFLFLFLFLFYSEWKSDFTLLRPVHTTNQFVPLSRNTKVSTVFLHPHWHSAEPALYYLRELNKQFVCTWYRNGIFHLLMCYFIPSFFPSFSL